MTKFNYYVTMATKNLSIATMCVPFPHPTPPPPIFFPFFTCDPFIKKWGYWWEPIGNLNGTCFEQMDK
jgi:hypothetical protein